MGAQDQRIGDAERDATARRLRDHFAEGRLTLEELNARLDAAFAAKTQGDLSAVLHDLPGPPPMPGASAQGSGQGGPRGGWRARPAPMFPGLIMLAAVFALLLFAAPLRMFGPGKLVLIIALIVAVRRWLLRGRWGYGGRCGRVRGPRRRRW